MADPNEGMLDDIGDDTGADASATADNDAQDAAPETGSQEQEQETAEGGDKPVKPNPARSAERPDGFVPVQALHQERAARAALEDRFNKFIDRFFKEREEPEQKQAEDGPPDEHQDPLGALAWTKAQLQKMQDAQRQESQQSEQQQQAHRQWQEAYGAVQAYFGQKVAEKPDLQSMYDGLRTSYAREYAALNPGIPPARVAQMVEQQEAAIIQWAYRNQYPIDAVIEQLAVSRGVQAKAQDAKPGKDQARDLETGQFTSAEAEKAAKIRESQERNGSLSSAPGAPVKPMDAKELAKMSEEDMWRYFESAGRKAGAKEFDRRMGFRS